MRVFRGDAPGGGLQGLQGRARGRHGRARTSIHKIQATQANDLACRWNCKAGKCGSCSAEVNGKPRLMCMTRMDLFQPGDTITVAPIRTFPLIRDLVTDVSYNYEKAKQVPPLRLKPPEPDGTYRMMQEDIDRIQEFHKCIECFLCQDVCHVDPRPRGQEARLRRAALLHQAGGPRHASAGHPRPRAFIKDAGGRGTLQHHQVLHRGVPRAHPHHRQRDHPAQGTGGRRASTRSSGCCGSSAARRANRPDLASVKIHEYQAKALLREFGVPVPARRRRHDARGGSSGCRAPGRQGGREGAGARGRPRQGRRHQARRRSGGRPARRAADPRHEAQDARRRRPTASSCARCSSKKPRPSTVSSTSR